MILSEQNIYINAQSYSRALVDKIIGLASDPAIENIVLDGFSGMGGVTEGFSRLPNWLVIACINHWDIAIQTHAKNHPDCLHMLEDFRIADINIIQYMVTEIRKRNPNVKLHTWFSLECTNFSNAKGGQSRDADSRTLAEHVDRYVIDLAPDVIWIENVKEFQLWGPMVPKVIASKNGKKKTLYVSKDAEPDTFYTSLIEDGYILHCPLVCSKKTDYKPGPWMIPCPHRKGKDFTAWKDYIASLGYIPEIRLLNCADYGVPQCRIRLIIQFNIITLSANWPVQTNSKKGIKGLPKWKPVGPCLNLPIEGESVLSFKKRKGVLVPRIQSAATIERLINGCNKHVIGKKEKNFVVNFNSSTVTSEGELIQNSGHSLNDTANTVTSRQGAALATVHTDHGLDEPARTQTANPKHFYLVNFQWFNNSFNPIENPANTIIARMDKSPNYLITLETGEFAIEVFENDPPHYVKLKKYMAENGIIAINMRMLHEIELLKIMSMDPATKLSKSSTANKKMIGNAVPPDLVEKLGAAWSNKLLTEKAA